MQARAPVGDARVEEARGDEDVRVALLADVVDRRVGEHVVEVLRRVRVAPLLPAHHMTFALQAHFSPLQLVARLVARGSHGSDLILQRMAGPAGSGGQKRPHHSLVVSGIDGSHIVTQRSTNGTPCPHDHCWHSWKNATQMPATIVRVTGVEAGRVGHTLREIVEVVVGEVVEDAAESGAEHVHQDADICG